TAIKDPPPINLSVPWMIIGYDDKLPIEPLSKSFCVEYIWSKDGTDTEIKLTKPTHQDYCLISTCVLDCEENPGYEFGMSNIVISHHFCQPENIKMKHPFIVSKNKQNWKDNWSLLRPLNNIFTGNSWYIPDSENYVFASLLYSSSSESSEQCCPLLLNINRKYPIVKSFNGVPKCMVT
ncbi:24534_t:CDS:2, partial [Racocetra persica]